MECVLAFGIYGRMTLLKEFRRNGFTVPEEFREHRPPNRVNVFVILKPTGKNHELTT
jgi:hypothetical protein